MKGVELYGQVRRAVFVEGMSRREAAQRFGIDPCGVSFVAVTQQFNTTPSMGRLTLNVLLSFAHFEREVTFILEQPHAADLAGHDIESEIGVQSREDSQSLKFCCDPALAEAAVDGGAIAGAPG